MITREQARSIAERFLRERGPIPGWEGIDRVLSPEESLAALAPVRRAVGSADQRWRQCWAAHVKGTAGGAIYISEKTGEVEFAGTVRGEPSPPAG